MSLDDMAERLSDHAPARGMSAASGTQSVGLIVRGTGAEFDALYRVQSCDLDELEHANNVSYLRWLEWITRKHNAAFGLGQDYLKANGTVFVVVDYQLRFLRACRLHEDVRIKTKVVEFGRCWHDRAYWIVAEKDRSLVFEGCSRWVSVSLTTARLTRMPDEYQRRMAIMAASSAARPDRPVAVG